MRSEGSAFRVGQLVGPMALFVVAGVPLVAYLWETMNQLMAGQVSLGRLAATIPAVAVLAGLLALLARAVSRWEGDRESGRSTPVRNP
jgi:hypothetical protein